MKNNTAPKKQLAADDGRQPSEFRGVPSQGESHGHGHKLAAVPVTPRSAKKPNSK